MFRLENLELILDGIREVESAGGKYLEGPPTKYGIARGAYQVLDSTGLEFHRRMGILGQYDPYDEEQQRRIARAILESYIGIFRGDVETAVLAYHTGPGNVIKGNIGPQGRAYVPKVKAAIARLSRQREDYNAA